MTSPTYATLMTSKLLDIIASPLGNSFVYQLAQYLTCIVSASRCCTEVPEYAQAFSRAQECTCKTLFF
jgi:hypothetical protein